jgi:hypothetical protein
MNHLTEEELILHFYGETAREDEGRVDEHLASCDACRASQATLKRVLHLVETTPMPEARPGFERDVWARLEPQLDQLAVPSSLFSSGWFSWMRAPQWAFAGVAALVVAAFVAGRMYSPAQPGSVTTTSTPAVADAGSPERVLRSAVGDHLERSQMMLVELVNSGDRAIGDEQGRAEDLVAANRLFRQSAEQSGDAAIVDILDDLERVLLEIANAPKDMTSGEISDLKTRIETEDLLFRVRVIASEMRQRNQNRGTSDRPALKAPVS